MKKSSKILVIAGGRSLEREISLRSGQTCYTALEELGYNVELYDLTDLSELVNYIKEHNIEYAFLITHGSYGEDGRLQGVLDWLNICYTGSNALSSALCMNKHYTREVLKANELPIARGDLLNNLNHEELLQYIPCMVKQAESGSSYGIYKVDSKEDLEEFLQGEDNLNPKEWLIEEYHKGIELTVSILERDGELEVLPILELRPQNEYYDLEAKYTKGMTEFILPANISPEETEQVKSIALQAFQVLGCSGFGRVDFILSPEHGPIILEINTLPGMTETSDLPAQAKAAGIEFNELVEIMLKTAE